MVCSWSKNLILAILPVESDPCDPNPCGPNSNPPRVIGDRCQCSCLSEMIGSPPNCRPECIINQDCPTDMACTNRKCRDPCPGLCGINAQCNVRNHVPICICNRGFVGDPFVQCRRQTSPRPVEIIQPCNPSPCGINAQCSEQRGAASCRCILDYTGNPYVECKPECTTNSECPNDKACVNNKCKDPCPGVCGIHASCRVNNHLPQCTCDPGYTGNPFVSCRRQTTRKFSQGRFQSIRRLDYYQTLDPGVIRCQKNAPPPLKIFSILTFSFNEKPDP